MRGKWKKQMLKNGTMDNGKMLNLAIVQNNVSVKQYLKSPFQSILHSMSGKTTL